MFNIHNAPARDCLRGRVARMDIRKGVKSVTQGEKVITGLECCISGNPAICKRVGCPYAEEHDGIGDTCIDHLMADALALLKAQGPRVMTYEELSTIDGAFIIESSAVHPLEWVFFFDTDANSDAVWVQGFDGERYIVYQEDYGKYIHCWTSRPTDEQREAVKWE